MLLKKNQLIILIKDLSFLLYRIIKYINNLLNNYYLIVQFFNVIISYINLIYIIETIIFN